MLATQPQRRSIRLGNELAGLGHLTQPLVEVGQTVLLGELDGASQVTRSFQRRGGRGRHLGGAAQPVDGFVADALGLRIIGPLRDRDGRRLAIVIRNQFRERVLALPGQALEPGCGRGVQATPFGPGQRLVGDFPDQDMAEGEEISTGGSNQVLLHQALGHILEPWLSLPVWRRVWWGRLERPDPGKPKSPAVDRSQLDETAFGRLQQVEPGEDRRLDRVGKLIPAGPLHDRSHQLAGKEWIAFGALHHAFDQLGRAPLEQLFDQLGGIPVAQRLQGDRHIVPASPAPPRATIEQLRPAQRDHQQRQFPSR